MSYDLYFWREKQPLGIEPASLCDKLGNDEEVEGVEQVSVDEIKDRFTKLFPDIVDEGAQLNWEGADSYFQVSWPVSTGMGLTQAIVVTCGFKLNSEIMNRIIDVGNYFGCAVYDPQVGERFVQPKPHRP